MNYRYENGRRYHAYHEGSKFINYEGCLRCYIFSTDIEQKGYMVPNDEEEKDRLDIVHEMLLTMMDRKLFLAPLSDPPARVLDLGTGTGIWAIDFGNILQDGPRIL